MYAQEKNTEAVKREANFVPVAQKKSNSSDFKISDNRQGSNNQIFMQFKTATLIRPGLLNGTAIQMYRPASVIGGMTIDLDTIGDDELLKIYKNYYLPNSSSKNYEQFGILTCAELKKRQIKVPTIQDAIEWVTSGKKKKPKYGLLYGRYLPVEPHIRVGNTHWPDSKPSEKHVRLTEEGVKLMYNHLGIINSGKSSFIHTDESFTNVYVKVNGIRWGLHLGEERQIFPIKGQEKPYFFDH